MPAEEDGASNGAPKGARADRRFETAPFSKSYDSVLIEDVPHIRQKPDFCGEACAAMFLKKLGEDVDQDYVFDQSGLSPALGRGCYAKELKAALQNIGFAVGEVWSSASSGRDLERYFDELHADLARGVPSIVCMHYSDSPETTEHFRLILGYDRIADEVIYHEPAEDHGAYRRMGREKFLKLWPLGTGGSRTIVRMRLDPEALTYGEISRGNTAADFAQHVMKLRPRLSRDFTVAVEPPFVIAGDEPADVVMARARDTVRLSVDVLKKDFFPKDPEDIVDIWLFKDDQSYRWNARKLFGHNPSTPYGYYSESENALIMNIATGGGTLIHEIVHSFMKPNFPDCPPWFNEGLGSLYEGVDLRDGHLVGLLNWRLPGLKEAIEEDSVPSFERLTSLDENEFYNEDPGTNYSQSRYLLYYLQEKGVLLDFYRVFFKDRKKDPTGYKTLRKILEEDDMDSFKTRWEKWVMELGEI